MEDWEKDEFLDFWVTENVGIEYHAVVPPENQAEDAKSPARNDAGAENKDNQDLIKHGLGIRLQEGDVAENESKGFQFPAGVNPAAENANVQNPVEVDIGSEDRGGAPVESAAPEGPMTREEIMSKWFSGLGKPDPRVPEEDASAQGLERACDTAEQEHWFYEPSSGTFIR
ncbi:uncharacterized protein CDV56_103589 [Aspergillus thermomutatus]|uniref:Uncharacterized protein n=1 Tax=Aspergillus thermomutatus TaxID=41047 RepID=A0A397GXZ8_ASPTH|nr:uncharacterized protein CDV56_103589 [Aspergillus thermomutatus]RHZ55209.1 hypothetical protein CDV56_103589 [Aspergillus thermomutatus]